MSSILNDLFKNNTLNDEKYNKIFIIKDTFYNKNTWFCKNIETLIFEITENSFCN